MKLIKKSFRMLLSSGCLTIIVLSSCSKSTSNDSTSSPKVVNTICDGNGKTTYYPLDISNKWEYTYLISGIKQSSPSLTAKSTKTFNSKVYVALNDPTGFLYIDDRYYREDATTHDIYAYYESKSDEYLEVPSTPTLNKSWTYLSNTRKVTNLSASLTTSSCSYTGLLEISEFNGATFVKKMYYKKGFGMVYRQEPSILSGKDEYIVSSVTLK